MIPLPKPCFHIEWDENGFGRVVDMPSATSVPGWGERGLRAVESAVLERLVPAGCKAYNCYECCSPIAPGEQYEPTWVGDRGDLRALFDATRIVKGEPVAWQGPDPNQLMPDHIYQAWSKKYPEEAAKRKPLAEVSR